MAQNRERRKQRQRRRPATTVSRPSAQHPRRQRLRRIVVAFLILIGLAGILAVTAPSDDPSGRAPIG